MAVNFPNSPTNGDIHNEKGRRWIYDSTSGAWKSIVNSTTIDTDTLIEGSNLFYTDTRVGDYLTTNSYATEAYVDSAVQGVDNTDKITEGSNNLFYTDARVQAKLGNVSGDIIPDTNIAYDLGSTTNRFRDLYLSGNSIQLGTREITQDNIPEVDLAIAPEVLEIQVSAPAAGQATTWLWTWETSSLPYARREITNSPEIQVPLYLQGTYTVNNFAAYDLFDAMTQTHSLYLKWVDGAGTDNLISWATSTGPVSDTHPDINSGNATDVQRINISVPSSITVPTLNAPSVSYTVTNNGTGAYTFSGSASGDNPNLGPFYRGGTYTINITATGHPFYFTTDNGTNFSAGTYFGEYTSGVTGSRTDSGTITFTVPNDAPDTLYYRCGNHSVMRGAITVKDLAVETNINGNYVVYFQHTQEGHKTPVELRPIPSLVNQMCLVYDAGSGKFVPQDLATYVENTLSFENKIREVAGTAELVVEDGSAVIAKVNVYDDSTYLPLVGNNPGDQAFATDTDILYIWDGSAWQQAGASNSDDLTEGTSNLFYTDARVNTYLSSNGYDTATNIVATITDSAPTTLDTLNELAAALGDDPNFATTVSTSIGTKWTQDNTKISNWDTAYGWGDHSTAGYLTSYTETDPVFSASAASGITTTNISNWNTAYGWGDHSTAGYQSASTALTTSTTFGGDVSGTYNAIVVANDSHSHSNYVLKTGDTMTGTLTYTTLNGPSTSSRDKIRVYGSGSYAIGMQNSTTYGGLNDWAMTFQMNNDIDRGFWWGHESHTTAEGAMSLTTSGHLFVGSRVDAPIFYDSNNTTYYADIGST